MIVGDMQQNRRYFEFLRIVREEARSMVSCRAQMAITMAHGIDPESIPDDYDRAARQFVSLIRKVRRELSAV